MMIGLVTATVSIPHAQSLKDKRSVLRSMKDRIMNSINVSAAEVGKQDLWQRADLAFVTVAADSETVQKRMSDISSMLRSDPRYVLTELHTQML